MIGNRFFIQVAAVALFGLLIFAFVAAAAWRLLGEEEFNRGLFQRTTSLVEMLLPPADAPVSDQAARLIEVAEELELDATLYAVDQTLIGANAEPAPWAQPTEPVGIWEATDSQRRWMTALHDGRVLFIDISRAPLPNETTAITATFVGLAIVISLLMYPLTRRVTRRLERLQEDVEKVGAGDLSVRVRVEGEDEIAKLAMSFNRSTQTIEDLLKRQRMLLANASHELRTPLARLRMGVELMETRNTEKRRADMRQDIAELDELVDDLITMTRYDSGSFADSFETVDLRELAQSESARTDGCNVIGEDAAPVRGDARMLRHMIRNLIDNGLKHGKPPVQIDFQSTVTGTSLTVSDQGPGIAPEHRERVFEPFYRGSDRQNVSGYGLGMPMIARIAELHGAKVTISQKPRSTISIHFPPAKLEAPQGEGQKDY